MSEGFDGKAGDIDPALYAAALLFADRGFHGTSLEEVALATGNSVPSLLKAFGSKEGLFYAAVEFSRELPALEERQRLTSLLPRAQKAVLNSKLRIFHREAIARLGALEGEARAVGWLCMPPGPGRAGCAIRLTADQSLKRPPAWRSRARVCLEAGEHTSPSS